MELFSIAGFSFSLAGDEAPVRDLAGAWSSFRQGLEGDGPRLALELVTVPSAARTEAGSGSIAPAGGMPVTRRSGPAALGTLDISGADFTAHVDWDRRTARVEGRSLRPAIEWVVRIALAELLLSRGGLLLHGVGVTGPVVPGEDARGGELAPGAVFVGASGAGKSTLAGLCASEGLHVLGDELVAALPGAQGFELHATPWHLGRAGCARLGAVGLLAWGAQHRLEPVAGGELARVLLPNAVVPVPSPEARASMFRSASLLVEQVPAVRLTFARAPGVRGALRPLLEPSLREEAP